MIFKYNTYVGVHMYNHNSISIQYIIWYLRIEEIHWQESKNRAILKAI